MQEVRINYLLEYTFSFGLLCDGAANNRGGPSDVNQGKQDNPSGEAPYLSEF